MNDDKNYSEIYFMVISIIIFISLTLFTNTFNLALEQFVSITIKIIPVFFIVFLLFTLINYFVESKKLARIMSKEKSVKGWFIAAISGIISTGPIYMWYPILNEMQKHGIKNEFIAIFLYNRAIKPALAPIMILYFGFTYTVILTVVLLIASIINGVIVQRILETF